MSVDILKKHPEFKGISGPLLFIILDGVGLYKGRMEGYEGNAFDLADTPNLDSLMQHAPVFMQLQAHGTAVGLPSDGDMGNSEVGHNAIGAGRIFEQGSKLVGKAIESGRIFEGQTWRQMVDGVRDRDKTFHLIGLLSDGNVHSHIRHLYGLLDWLFNNEVKRIRIHPLADGRDVDPVTYHLYITDLESRIRNMRGQGCDIAIASGGGRMQITMDRYEADWSMVERGWRTHVQGKGRLFPSAIEAIKTLRDENPDCIDQDLPPFVIDDGNGNPTGPIVEGDSVLLFNFRGDRAIEISRAFTEKDFTEFERGELPDLSYAGMMEYDGDRKIPPRYLVDPPAIERTMSEYLAHNGIKQLAVSETQKFGHVTYFWNGNNSEKFDEKSESWIEIPSDVISFDKKPAMKARESSRVIIDELAKNENKFLRINLANGDMVGHTGSLKASIEAMEVVDECVGEMLKAAEKAGATVVITADHGNCDQMFEVDKKSGQIKLDAAGANIIKTSHTLSPVPFILTGKHSESFAKNKFVANPGLANIAASLLMLLGYEAPEDYLSSLLVLRT